MDEGELAAFISYAQAFPAGLVALIDTYDVLESGLPNFICVAMALADFGYAPVGVRLDSGDLAQLSKACRATFKTVRCSVVCACALCG
jgi:nicotinate phosphoribosyltransferase